MEMNNFVSQDIRGRQGRKVKQGQEQGQKCGGSEHGSSMPETVITVSGHKQGYLQSHAQGLTSPDFKCVEHMGQGPGRASQKTRTMPAVSTTCGRTGSGTV